MRRPSAQPTTSCLPSRGPPTLADSQRRAPRTAHDGLWQRGAPDLRFSPAAPERNTGDPTPIRLHAASQGQGSGPCPLRACQLYSDAQGETSHSAEAHHDLPWYVSWSTRTHNVSVVDSQDLFSAKSRVAYEGSDWRTGVRVPRRMPGRRFSKA